MILLSFIRIIKFSLQDIWRNIWLSIATVTILVLALFSINMLLTVQVIGQTAVEAIKEKIDISLYIKADASEEEIMSLKAKISNLSQVKDVSYISKAEALEFFWDKNKDKPEVLEALRELGKNPLTPSLIIKPKNSEEATQLTQELNNITSNIIESRNFTDHKLVLEKINNITDKASEAGAIISAIFVLITLLVVYNAIRVSIYTHREEIGIMRLVGASNSFVYMPFLLSGLIYTLVGVAAAIVVFYPFLTLLQPYLEAFFVGYDINILNYFSGNFIEIFGLEFVGLAIINTLASFVAVSKYAKV
ncbi:hypothetical protein COV49_04550 [Candidatus Falkowbacteria bacterium CG11_big_fil_rev_8_21_14_0_20_39_10]|uniref:Cell division protein FtsX n=1 Tax=Candidatus Falkowbacteria bacterium CG11_big_fil_rev_8_21_14_0_20_39_10 TaxID=1974570 RepID=A0A2M6K7Z1_9BACT|nr:MAG: hypothetical protein COV49_04550 [Candidatus Falkowbacteria bacterium CG11_big_fil_rev_8_21_14_0_20_39_10]